MLGMRISAVVPTLGPADHLPACLHSLAGADEIVIADGGPNAATAEIARQAGARLIEAPRGRGLQLAAGAAASSGDILLFVHSDTRLSPGWSRVARMHVARSSRPACFRLRLDDPAWQARLIERGVSFRTRLLGLPYGDQGLLISREAYDRSGGFRPLPLLEDVELLRRIEGPIMLEAEALTSAERWRRDGWARRSLRNLGCYSLWRLGVSPARVAALYDRPRRASPSPPGHAFRVE
jgi:rSAM/selenodomain-associated transferase 2